MGLNKQIIDLIKTEIKNKDHFNYLEIGIAQSDSAKKLINTFKNIKYFGIDPWLRYDEPKHDLFSTGLRKTEPKKFKNWDTQEKWDDVAKKVTAEIKKLNKDSKIFRGFAHEIIPELNDSFDIIYIDGNHEYEYVKIDIEKSLLKLKDGGIIICDDYSYWSGVKKAVNELKNKYNVTTMAGHGIIRKK